MAESGQPALWPGGRMRPPPWPPEPDSNLATRPPVPGLLGPHVLAAPRGGPLLPLAPWPTKVQTAEEAGSRPPAARMPAVHMPGRLESRRPWMPAAPMPTARMPAARMPAARMPVHLAPLLQRRRPGHKEGPCRPRCWPADKEEAQSGPPVAADWPVPLIPSLT